MFGWDFQNSKSDRVKLFFFILSVFLLISFTATFLFRSMNTEKGGAKDSKLQSATESTENIDSSTHDGLEEDLADNVNRYDQTEHFSNEQLEKTKEVAVNFVKSFHTYSADEPMKYLESAKPYMTEALYEKMERTMRREPLDRSYLSVKETDVTPVVNPSSLVVRWNVIVIGEAKSVDGTVKETEDWYLVGVREVDGEWKIEDVRVNVPN